MSDVGRLPPIALQHNWTVERFRSKSSEWQKPTPTGHSVTRDDHGERLAVLRRHTQGVTRVQTPLGTPNANTKAPLVGAMVFVSPRDGG